jgi:hypothetical protein
MGAADDNSALVEIERILRAIAVNNSLPSSTEIGARPMLIFMPAGTPKKLGKKAAAYAMHSRLATVVRDRLTWQGFEALQGALPTSEKWMPSHASRDVTRMGQEIVW